MKETAALATRATINKQPHNSTQKQPIAPQSIRLQRLLAALLKGTPTRTELDQKIGTTNSPEYVSQLRKQRWHIQTERVSVKNRDGRISRIGRYSLAPSQREAAHNALQTLGVGQ